MQHAIHDDIAVLYETVALLDASGEPLERARAHADLGAALRRAGRPVEAREPLRIAVDLAYRSGATALEEHALAGLRASGGRPRRRVVTGPGALTRSERRIADLAAAGGKNREIAEALFVTPATVEYHLRNAYRKLGIKSRAQLRKALAPEHSAQRTKLSVRVRGGSAAGVRSASRSNSWLTAQGVDLAPKGALARSAPSQHSPYRYWQSRSSAATATI
jgi:DNA-binding CsgD family transcriptional regulator